MRQQQNRSFEEKQNNFVARRLREKGFDPRAASPSSANQEVAAMLSQQRHRAGSRGSSDYDVASAHGSRHGLPSYHRDEPNHVSSGEGQPHSPSGSRVSSRELAEMKARAREDTHFPSLRNRNNDGAPKEYTESITGHGGGRRRGYEQRNDDNHSVAQSTATQKSEYLQTLEQQIKEKEDRKRKEKEEQARYEKKMEEEAQKFDYFGSGKRGGGGDPVRDGNGGNITYLKQMNKDLATRSPSNRSVQSANTYQSEYRQQTGIRRGNQTNDSSGVMAALFSPGGEEPARNRSRGGVFPSKRVYTADTQKNFPEEDEKLSPRDEIHSVGPPAAYRGNGKGFESFDPHPRGEGKYDEPEDSHGRSNGNSEEVVSLRHQLEEAKQIVADQHERLSDKDANNQSLRKENEELRQETEKLRERLSTAISILESYRERYGPLE